MHIFVVVIGEFIGLIHDPHPHGLIFVGTSLPGIDPDITVWVG
jgi:hypothetical protein